MLSQALTSARSGEVDPRRRRIRPSLGRLASCRLLTRQSDASALNGEREPKNVTAACRATGSRSPCLMPSDGTVEPRGDARARPLMLQVVEPEMLRSGDEGEAAAVLCASHAECPAFRFVFPDPERRRKALFPFFVATIRDAIRFRTAHCIHAHGRMLAIAVWLPPGALSWSAHRKLRATPVLLRVFAAYPQSFRTFMSFGTNLERAHPRERHWYLVALGVRPDAQRMGLGTRLLEPMLDLADSDAVPCYLESSNRANVGYYRRFGFEVIDAEVHLVPDGPTHVVMRRRPRPSTSLTAPSHD